MKKIDNVPWELIGALLILIAVVILPGLAGIAVVKLYRMYQPRENPDTTDILLGGAENNDSFGKMYVIGWVIFSPILYFLYSIYQPG